MVRPQTKKQLTKPKKIILWLVCIVIVATFFWYLAPLVQSYILRTSLDSESKQVLTESRPNLQGTVDERINTMVQQLGVALPAAYTVTYKSCYTDHDDSGWVANNYNYNCLLTKYALYEVSNNSPLMETIATNAKPASERRIVHSDYYGKIYDMPTDFSNLPPGIANDLPFNVYVVKDNTYSSVKSVLAVKAVSSDSKVVAYANEDAVDNRLILSQQGIQSLDIRKTYIVLQSSEEYFHKDVGCRIPSFIFCDSPI